MISWSKSFMLVWIDWIVQCLTSPPTQYRLYGRRFLQVSCLSGRVETFTARTRTV